MARPTALGGLPRGSWLVARPAALGATRLRRLLAVNSGA